MAVDLLQFGLNALAISSLYVLVALGFTLIFGVGGVLNFAHGALLTIGAYTAYYAAEAWNTDPWIALAVAAVTAGLVGGLTFRLAVRHIRDRPVVTIIVTLLLGFTFEAIIRARFGGGSINMTSPVPGVTTILGRTVQTHLVLAFVLSWVAIFLLLSYVNYTPTGNAILATNMNWKGAVVVGIDPGRINTYVWVVAGAFAGVAGVLLLMFQTGSPSMGLEPMVLSFSIVVLGGLGSIRGSILGAYIIGTLDTAMTTFVDPSLTGLVGLVILVLVLLVRPKGLFGRETEF